MTGLFSADPANSSAAEKKAAFVRECETGL